MADDLGRCTIGAPSLPCGEPAIGICKGCGKPACEKHLHACRDNVFYVKYRGWFTQDEIDAMKAKEQQELAKLF